MTRALLSLALLVLLFPACEEDIIDPIAPENSLVFPVEFDTLAPGVYTLEVVATDDREMKWVEFWEGGWLIGLVSRSDNDTFRIGWDCRNDLRTNYYFTFHAVDEAWNYTTLNSSVFIPR